jgi:hypothetical protein
MTGKNATEQQRDSMDLIGIVNRFINSSCSCGLSKVKKTPVTQCQSGSFYLPFNCVEVLLNCERFSLCERVCVASAMCRSAPKGWVAQVLLIQT